MPNQNSSERKIIVEKIIKIVLDAVVGAALLGYRDEEITALTADMASPVTVRSKERQDPVAETKKTNIY